MTRRSRGQLGSWGEPHIRSAHIKNDRLTLNLQREVMDYPRTVHVIAVVSNSDRSDSAIHSTVQFETDNKRRKVKFILAEDSSFGISPVVVTQSSEADTSRELDFPELGASPRIEIIIRDSEGDREYDKVALETNWESSEYEVTAIND